MPSHTALGVTMAQYLLHGLAHIERNAVDMYADTLCRGCADDVWGAAWPPTRAAFVLDIGGGIVDEARHFGMLDARLRQLGTRYGDLPAHTRLWQLAVQTRHAMVGRLAVVPLVQEARGLDAGPRMVQKLKSSGDAMSAAVVGEIVDDEVNHVRLGLKWFKVWCDATPGFHGDYVAEFHSQVRVGPWRRHCACCWRVTVGAARMCVPEDVPLR